MSNWRPIATAPRDRGPSIADILAFPDPAVTAWQAHEAIKAGMLNNCMEFLGHLYRAKLDAERMDAKRAEFNRLAALCKPPDNP